MSRMFDCYLCGASVSEPHADTCPLIKRQPAPPTEMTSLLEIKDKLDLALAMLNDRKGQDKKRDEQFNALVESQGKLLARLDALDAGLHETAMRNHQQVRFEMGQISAGTAGQIARLQLDLREALEKLVPGYDPFGRKAKPRKASKKARRR